MKRLTAVILILCMSIITLTGCNGKTKNEENDAAMQTAILNEFSQISQIPRESGHERAMSSYLKSWAKENGFEAVRDGSNNVIITAPASEGYEDAPVTILQCNMDTRIAVADGTDFDPQMNPVTLVDNGDTLTAAGTSIGADSGIGMATALYVLKHTPNHGPVRAIFTTDGETGMTGAEKLKAKYLDGDFLINLAWNSDRTVGLGSPGTASYEMTHKIEWAPPQNAIPYLLTLSGLKGGDADKDMGKGRANAIKIIGEVLANAQGKGILFELGAFNGGVSSDTIPTSASALIVINGSDEKKMQAVVNNAMDAFKGAYGDVEENYSFTYEKAEMPDKVASFEDNGSIISFIYGIINGIQTKSETYSDVIESASNLGMVSTATGSFLCQVSVASNSDAKLYTITNAHEAISGMSGMQYTYHEGVPHWRDHPNSILYGTIRKIHSDLFGDKISGTIVYHKMECGWFVKKNPKLQVISIGPMIKHAGLPDETLVKDSVIEPAKTVMKFLEQIKEVGQLANETEE